MKLRPYHFLPVIFLFAQCFPTVEVAGQFTEQEFNEMADQMAKGPVADMTVEELQQQLERGRPIFLLDTREQEEFDASHLASARWVGYDDFDLKKLNDLPKDALVVTYCSVGYRSERIGEKLQKAGFQNVRNLKGGIFDWTNNGFPMVNNQNMPTQKVHGYNEKWGRWVKRGEVVF